MKSKLHNKNKNMYTQTHTRTLWRTWTHPQHPDLLIDWLPPCCHGEFQPPYHSTWLPTEHDRRLSVSIFSSSWQQTGCRAVSKALLHVDSCSSSRRGSSCNLFSTGWSVCEHKTCTFSSAVQKGLMQTHTHVHTHTHTHRLWGQSAATS